MSNYRRVIYQDYYQNQVNKGNVDQGSLLEQQSWYYGRELIRFVPQEKNSAILDIGCGFGSFIHALKKDGYVNVKGIDLSPEQVKVAHDLGISEVELTSSDDWFQKGNKVDCIVGIDIIEHYTKDELVEFLGKVLQSLNPGGRVLFRTPNMDAPLASVYAFADFSHDVFLNKSSALQLFHSCGFSQVKVHPSMIKNQNPIKEALRRCLWWGTRLFLKISLFASGRTWNDVVFTPNLIIEARKP